MNGIGCKQRDNREVNTICVLVSHHLIMHDIVEASVTTTTVHSQVPTIKTNRQVPVNFLTLFFMPSLFFPAVHKMKPREENVYFSHLYCILFCLIQFVYLRYLVGINFFRTHFSLMFFVCFEGVLFTHSVSPFFLFGCCFQFLFHSIWNLFVQIALIGWVPWQLSPLAHLQQQIHINIHLEINLYAGKTHKTSNFACDDSLRYRHFNHSFMYYTHSRAHFTSPKNSDI